MDAVNLLILVLTFLAVTVICWGLVFVVCCLKSYCKGQKSDPYDHLLKSSLSTTPPIPSMFFHQYPFMNHFQPQPKPQPFIQYRPQSQPLHFQGQQILQSHQNHSPIYAFPRPLQPQELISDVPALLPPHPFGPQSQPQEPVYQTQQPPPLPPLSRHPIFQARESTKILFPLNDVVYI